MDPTTGPPPSPEKPPPPPLPPPPLSQHPHIGCNPISHQEKGEPSYSRNMDNFRALVLKLARPLLPAQLSLIERRFDDFFPDQLIVPDHPPYAAMIQTALWELNEEGGSSEEAISDFIKSEYHELPWAHATILKHNLRELCANGEIVLTHDNCYLRHSSITELAPSPSACHRLSPDYPCISPFSSPSSSSSGSLCSTPSSSSTSSSPSHYKMHKLSLKRKRKGKERRGRKKIHGRGRGMPPKMIQVKGRDEPPKNIQKRKRGRPRKDKIGEKSQVDVNQVDGLVVEEVNQQERLRQVTEDQNEVTGLEIEENAIQDEEQDVSVRINQQGQEDGAGKEQNQLEIQRNNIIKEKKFPGEDQIREIFGQKDGVFEGRDGRRIREKRVILEQWRSHIRGKREIIGKKDGVFEERDGRHIREKREILEQWRSHIREKREILEQWRSGNKQNDVSEEQNQPCTTHNEGTKEPLPSRKQCKVLWVGRRGHIKGNGGSVAGTPSGSEHDDVSDEQDQPCGKVADETKEQVLPRKQRNITWVGRGVRNFKAGRILQEQSEDEETELEDDVVTEGQDVVTIGDEDDEHVEGLKLKDEKGSAVEGLTQKASAGRNQSEDWQYDVSEQQDSQHVLLMTGVRVKIQPCEQNGREGMEPEVEVAEKMHLKERLENEVLEENVMDEQHSLMVRREAPKHGFTEEWNGQQKQVKGASMEQSGPQLQQDDVTQEHVDLQKQSKEEADDTFHSCRQQQGGSLEQNQFEKREVEMAGEQMDEDNEEHDPVIVRCGSQVRIASTERTAMEKQHDDVIEEQVQPQEQSTKDMEYQASGQHQRGSIQQERVGNQAEMVGDTRQEEEPKSKEIHEEQCLMNEHHEERDVVMIQCEAKIQDESVEQTGLEEKHDYVNEEQVQPKEQLTESSNEKPHPYGQHQRREGDKETLEKSTATAGEPHQHEGQQSEKIQKDKVLMHEDAEELQDSAVIQSEAQVREANVELNELEEQHEDVVEEQFQIQLQQQKGSVSQDMEERQVGKAGEPNEVNQKEMPQMNEENEQPGLVLIQSKTHTKCAGVEQNESIEQEVTKEKFQPCGEQREKVEKEMPVKQVEMTGYELRQHEEKQREKTQKAWTPVNEDTEGPQDAVKIQSKAQATGASLELNDLKEKHDNITEKLVQPQEQCIEGTEDKSQWCGHDRVKDGEVESAEDKAQLEEQQSQIAQKEIGRVNEVTEVQHDLLMNPSEARAKGEHVEQNRLQEQHYATGKHVQAQDHCMEGTEQELQPHGLQQRDVMEQVQQEKGEVEVPGDRHQREKQPEEKHIGRKKGLSEVQQDLVIMQSEAQSERENVEHGEVYQEQLEKREVEIAEEKPKQEEWHEKEVELMNHCTEVIQDLGIIQSVAQVEGTSVEQNESREQQEDTKVESAHPQELCREGTKEENQAIRELTGQRKEEKEATLEKNQTDECEKGVAVERCQPQEQCLEDIEEKNQPHLQQIEISEKESQLQEQCSFSSEKLSHPDHQNEDEHRQASRHGLRSKNKKKEATKKLEMVPVRRSPRLLKTNPEATAVTEESAVARNCSKR